MQLLLDVMCGGLVAYLRMCNHDTVYAGDRGLEAQLAELAAAGVDLTLADEPQFAVGVTDRSSPSRNWRRRPSTRPIRRRNPSSAASRAVSISGAAATGIASPRRSRGSSDRNGQPRVATDQ